MSDIDKQKHTIFMANRESLEMTGIRNVDSFNDTEIVANSDYGDLMIKGTQLNVETLDLDSGNLKITGDITAIVYSHSTSQRSFFKKVFS